MTSPPVRWFVLLLCACLLGLGLAACPASAAESSPGTIVASDSAAIFGGLTDNVFGNRSRMVQFTFIAFGLGVLILVTATRKQ